LKNLVTGLRHKAEAFEAISHLNQDKQAKIADAIAKLSEEDIVQLESGKPASEIVAAAPGGGLAALLALLGTIFSNPSTVANLVTMITTLISLFRPAGAAANMEPETSAPEAKSPGDAAAAE
jgi:hypothetical protein